MHDIRRPAHVGLAAAWPFQPAHRPTGTRLRDYFYPLSRSGVHRITGHHWGDARAHLPPCRRLRSILRNDLTRPTIAEPRSEENIMTLDGPERTPASVPLVAVYDEPPRRTVTLSDGPFGGRVTTRGFNDDRRPSFTRRGWEMTRLLRPATMMAATASATATAWPELLSGGRDRDDLHDRPSDGDATSYEPSLWRAQEPCSTAAASAEGPAWRRRWSRP